MQAFRHRFAGRTAVITGAAEGIGRALAAALAHAGARLILVDRQASLLEATAAALRSQGAEVQAQVLDMGDRAAVAAWSAGLLARQPVDILINNAGVALTGRIELLEWEDLDWVMRNNFGSVVHGVKCFLPHLRSRPEAWLVNVSSIFGVVAVQTQAGYNASKFAIRGFTEALQQEVRDTPGLCVSLVLPGGVATRIAEQARYRFAPGREGLRQRTIDYFARVARTTPEQAAGAILRGMARRQARILIGADARALDWAARLFPAGYARRLRRFLPEG